MRSPVAEEGALATLHLVEPVVGLEAADPAPPVVAYRAFHHGTASIFLQLAIALRTLVEYHLAVDGLVQHLRTIHAPLFIMQLFWLVGLLAQVASFLIAFCTGQFVLFFLVAMHFFI